MGKKCKPSKPKKTESLRRKHFDELRNKNKAGAVAANEAPRGVEDVVPEQKPEITEKAPVAECPTVQAVECPPVQPAECLKVEVAEQNEFEKKKEDSKSIDFYEIAKDQKEPVTEKKVEDMPQEEKKNGEKVEKIEQVQVNEALVEQSSTSTKDSESILTKIGEKILNDILKDELVDELTNQDDISEKSLEEIAEKVVKNAIQEKSSSSKNPKTLTAKKNNKKKADAVVKDFVTIVLEKLKDEVKEPADQNEVKVEDPAPTKNEVKQPPLHNEDDPSIKETTEFMKEKIVNNNPKREEIPPIKNTPYNNARQEFTKMYEYLENLKNKKETKIIITTRPSICTGKSVIDIAREFEEKCPKIDENSNAKRFQRELEALKRSEPEFETIISIETVEPNRATKPTQATKHTQATEQIPETKPTQATESIQVSQPQEPKQEMPEEIKLTSENNGITNIASETIKEKECEINSGGNEITNIASEIIPERGKIPDKNNYEVVICGRSSTTIKKEEKPVTLTNEQVPPPQTETTEPPPASDEASTLPSIDTKFYYGIKDEKLKRELLDRLLEERNLFKENSRIVVTKDKNLTLESDVMQFNNSQNQNVINVNKNLNKKKKKMGYIEWILSFFTCCCSRDEVTPVGQN